MVNLRLHHGEHLISRDAQAPAPTRTSALIPELTNPFGTGPASNPGGSLLLTSVPATPTASFTGLITNTPGSTSVGQSTSSTSSSAASSTSDAAAASSGDMPLTTKLVAIIVPIAAVIIIVPILYMLWVRYRTRNMKKLESEPRYSPPPQKEPKFRQTSPVNLPKQSFLPPLFHERQPTKEGSLFDEVRVSMDSARRNESVGLFDRTRDDFGTKESSYGVYALRRSLEDKGRTDSIGLFDLPRHNNHNDRSSPALQPQRGPSPTLPSPKVPLFERPPSEAWPLPASKLPSPQALYDPHINTNKAFPAGGMATSSPPNMPLPAPPGSRQENHQTNSFASSNILPHTQDYRPSSSGRPQGGNTQRSASGHDSASSSRYASPVLPAFSTFNAGEHRGRQRDSDLVSELSYRSPSSDRDPKRKSIDAISVVSAISHRKRRSERDADALSMVSALSPEQDETPRIPIEHYPRT